MAETSAVPAVGVSRGISGKWVVIGLLAFGIGTTGLIYVYWDLHTRPFRPLMEALGREFPYSIPKVEGGRHKGGPLTLRIVLRVKDRPDAESPATQQIVNRIVEIVRAEQFDKFQLADFEVVQLYLMYLAPEKAAVEAAFTFRGADLVDRAPFPTTP
jgi:hypothetical protein